MPQLRLTQKFAKDLHIIHLEEPQNTISIFDDWVIDVIRVQRKKVAMLVHVKSYLPFFIPYSAIGGAQNVAYGLSELLSNWITQSGYAQYCDVVKELFSKPIIFCKTSNRKALGHMNDYKRCAPFSWQQVLFDDINWKMNAYELSTMPITVSDSDIAYPTAERLMLHLLEKGL